MAHHQKLTAEEKAVRATDRRRAKLHATIGKHMQAIRVAKAKITEIDAAAPRRKPSEFTPVCYEGSSTEGRDRPSNFPIRMRANS